MNRDALLKRVIRAIVIFALAGFIAFGLTAWLAPPAVSPYQVAIVVAIIIALGAFMPTAIRKPGSKRSPLPCEAHDTYYDLSLSLTKEEGSTN